MMSNLSVELVRVSLGKAHGAEMTGPADALTLFLNTGPGGFPSLEPGLVPCSLWRYRQLPV